MGFDRYKGSKEETFRFKDGSKIIKRDGILVIIESLSEYKSLLTKEGNIFEPPQPQLKKKDSDNKN